MNDVSQEREIKKQLGQGNNFPPFSVSHPALKEVLRDKRKCAIDCVNYFPRYLLVYQPYCPVLCCQGNLGELSEKSVHNLYVRVSLPLGKNAQQFLH